MKLQICFIASMIAFSQLSFAQKPTIGKYTLENSSGVYLGELVNGQPNGKGTTTFKNGDRHTGEYVRGKREGKGVYEFADGEKYDGDWYQDQQHGLGTYFFSNNNRYEGSWYRDYQHGKGTMFYYNGDKYVGLWYQDKRQGKGKYTFANGAFYDGDWMHDMMDGEGVYDWANGNVYRGQWHANMKNGKGIFVYSSGDKYNGTWLDDQQHGTGIYTYHNGDRYEGPYVKGQRTGDGVFTYRNGDKYVGHFLNGDQDGYGKFTWKSGAKYDGYWKQNKPYGKGRYTSDNGDVYEVDWENGTMKRIELLKDKEERLDDKISRGLEEEDVKIETEKVQEKVYTNEDIWHYIHQISKNGNLVSEETKDKAFDAPTSLLTEKKWVFNNEKSRNLSNIDKIWEFDYDYSSQKGMIKFNADGTFKSERVIQDKIFIWKVTYSGAWTRFKYLFISINPNPLSVKLECVEYNNKPYQQLSNRLKYEVNEEAKRYIKEIRYRLNCIKNSEDTRVRMDRLDNEFLILEGITYVNETKLCDIYERRSNLSKEIIKCGEIIIPAIMPKKLESTFPLIYRFTPNH